MSTLWSTWHYHKSGGIYTGQFPLFIYIFYNILLHIFHRSLDCIFSFLRSQYKQTINFFQILINHIFVRVERIFKSFTFISGWFFHCRPSPDLEQQTDVFVKGDPTECCGAGGRVRLPGQRAAELSRSV